jgi:hypothetical protein
VGFRVFRVRVPGVPGRVPGGVPGGFRVFRLLQTPFKIRA